MKKSIRIVAVAMAALMLCMALVSCDLFGKKLDGKYECDAALIGKYTMKFEGSKVTLTRTNLFGSIDKWEGKYVIEDDTIDFTFTDDDGDEIEGVPFGDETYTFEENDEDIQIGNFTFEKVDD